MPGKPGNRAHRRNGQTSSRRNTPRTSLNTLPVELCAEIASYLPPHRLCRLTRLDKASYAIFNPILYRVIRHATWPTRLLHTLAVNDRLAASVLKLGIGMSRGQQFSTGMSRRKRRSGQAPQGRLVDEDHARKALKHLTSSEAALVELDWQSDLLLQGLGSILADSAGSSRLRHLSIQVPQILTYDRRNVEMSLNFDFIPLPSLQSICITGRLEGLDDVPSYLGRLSSALDNITCGTSDMRVFKLTLLFHRYLSPTEECRGAMEHLVESINALRFRHLHTLALHIADFDGQAIDFQPFLHAHPSIQNVNIDLRGEKLDPLCLTGLTRFDGTASDCAVICNAARPISCLHIQLDPDHWDLGSGDVDGLRLSSDDAEERALLLLLRELPFLNKLHITPIFAGFVSDAMRQLELPCFTQNRGCMDYQCVSRLSQACPRLTHLELYVDDNMEWIAAALRPLQQLVWLKLHLEKYFAPDDYGDGYEPMAHDPYEYFDIGTGADMFPVDQRITDVSTFFAGALPKLEEVELHLQGWLGGEYFSPNEGDPSDFEVSYVLFLTRSRDGKTRVHNGYDGGSDVYDSD